MRVETPDGKTVLIKDGNERTVFRSDTAGEIVLPTTTADALSVTGAFTPAAGGACGRYVDVSFTATQVKALNAPASIVAAPGSGYALVFDGAVAYYTYVTTAFTIGTASGLAIRYTDGSGTQVGQCAVTGFIDQNTAQLRYVQPWRAASGASQITPVAAAPLVLQMLTADVTDGGTSTLKLRVYYRMIPATL